MLLSHMKCLLVCVHCSGFCQKIYICWQFVYVFNKAMQRLHLIRRLQHFGVSRHILEMVYKNLVESVICFNMTMWYGLLPVKEKQKLGRVVASDSVKHKAQVIIEDCSHPLNTKFQLLPSKNDATSSKEKCASNVLWVVVLLVVFCVMMLNVFVWWSQRLISTCWQ